MNGHSRHPGTEELAEFRAGVTDGARGEQVAAHLAECLECTSVADRLGEVPALLAAIPVPAMPGDIEARITSALTAEAARRATAPVDVAAAEAAAPDPAPAAPANSRMPSQLPNPAVPLPSALQRRRPAKRRTPRRRSVTAPLGAVVAAAACLVLAFVGYQLSDTGHIAGSSVASGGGTSPHGGRNSPDRGQAPGADSRPAIPSPVISGGPAKGLAPTAAFDVLVSTTNFRKATLREQVRQQLSTVHSTGPVPGPGTSGSTGPVKSSPGATPTTAGDGWVSPSKSLVGCVQRLAGDARPELVEQATYQSQSVYMIAIANRAWVVAHGCTAANPEMLASVALPGR